MSFSNSKEVQDAMKDYQKALNMSSKFYRFFVDAQVHAPTNPNFKQEINIDEISVSSNDLYTNKHSDQSPLCSK